MQVGLNSLTVRIAMLEKLPDSIGHALVNQRAGMESVVYNRLHAGRQTQRLEVHSSFAFNARLHDNYTADGAGISRSLEWDNAPAASRSFAVLAEDADSPTPRELHFRSRRIYRARAGTRRGRGMQHRYL
jgi:phosphatidylethanolamine-binding protein (PEBP) family uncharacterized protein